MVLAIVNGVIALMIALAIHILLFAFINQQAEQSVQIKGGTISVTYGAGGYDSQASQADLGGEVEPAPKMPSNTAVQTREDIPKDIDQLADELESFEVEEEQPPLDSNETALPSDDRNSTVSPETTVPSPASPVSEPEAQEPLDEQGQASEAQSNEGANTVDSAASASEGSPDADPDSSTTQTEEGNAQSDNYAGEVLKHLSRVRRPRSPGSGAAEITFTIGPDGELEEVGVSKSSGSRRFDREALRVVERGAPYPVPPEGVNRTFTVEIEGR